MLWLGSWLLRVEERFSRLVRLINGNNRSVWILLGLNFIVVIAIMSAIWALFRFIHIIGGEHLQLAFLVVMVVVFIFAKIAQDRAMAKKDSATTKD